MGWQGPPAYPELRFIKSPSWVHEAYNLVIGKGTTSGQIENEDGWVTIDRDILEDYRRVFSAEKASVPPITGMGLKSDSNDTHTSTEAWLSSLELLAVNGSGSSR